MSLLSIVTARLVLREFNDDDAPFVLRLVNEPGWLQFIGDRGVRTLNDAREYIGKLRKSYEKFGHGLLCIELNESKEAIGMCGLIKRDTLADVDIGYAVLAQHHRQGYAIEAAQAVLAQATVHGIRRVVAITNRDNLASMQLLRALGMRFERETPGDSGGTLNLFAVGEQAKA